MWTFLLLEMFLLCFADLLTSNMLKVIVVLHKTITTTDGQTNLKINFFNIYLLLWLTCTQSIRIQINHDLILGLLEKGVDLFHKIIISDICCKVPDIFVDFDLTPSGAGGGLYFL